MADEHFFPGPGDFTTGLGAAPFYGGPASSYAPLQGLDAAAAAMQGFGLAWAADLQLPDSSAAAAAHFDSALSSLVSSPSHNGAGGYYGGGGGADDVAIIGDLIGRLGGICGAAAGAASASNSCYSTPLSSPPHGAASPAAVRGVSCGGRLSRVASSKSLGAGAATPPGMGSPEDDANMRSGGSTEIMRDAAPPPPPAKGGGGAARKRKAPAKGKATSSAMTPAAAAAATASSKRLKLAAGVGAECKDDDGADTAEDNAAAAAAAPEPEKGYIHVRARRGQATDSHSLAERVRRERISERMKMLESLVPGCNKITGKALMLDEIINYVQSLQRQVEFLSMKLSTMNPDVDVDARYHQTAMLASPQPQHQPAAAFPSYAAADPSFVTAAHPPEQQQQQLVDSCGGSFHPGSGGWDEAQEDLQSVVARHNHAAVHGHDLSYPSTAARDSNFTGQQQQLLLQQQQGAAAARSHMKLE